MFTVMLLSVLAAATPTDARPAAATQATTQPAIRFRYHVPGPMRFIVTGQTSQAEWLPAGGESRLAEQTDRTLTSTVYLAPIGPAGDTAPIRVTILSVQDVTKALAFGADATGEARRRPSRGRSIALDEYEIDAQGRLLTRPGVASRPVESVFTLIPGRHIEVPPLPAEPVVPGEVVEERLTAREGPVQVARKVAPEPVAAGGRSCTRLSLQAHSLEAGELNVSAWSADYLIDPASGFLVEYQGRVRFVVGTSRREALTSLKGAAPEAVAPERYDRMRDELQALQALGPALAEGPTDTAARLLADLDRRFPDAAFPEKRAQARQSIDQARAREQARPGESTVLLPEFDTYALVSVPTDYDPAKQYRLLVLLHGAGARPDGYSQSWRKTLAGKPFIVAGLKSIGVSWGPNLDRDSIKRLVEVLGRAYSIDRGNVFLLGHSAGATMAYVAGLAAEGMEFRGAVIAAGTLHRQLRGTIRRQADPKLAERLKKMTFYVFVGEKDQNFPPAAVKGDADLLRMAGAAVVYRELPGQGHAYPTSENAAIAEWLERQ